MQTLTSTTTNKFSSHEINILLKLAIPLMLTGFIESLNSFFTIMFVAQLGVRELAASAIVSRTFVTLMAVVWGVLSSVSILVSQKYGEKNQFAISQVLRDGLLLAFSLVIPAMLVLWNIAPILQLTGQDESTIQLVTQCMHGLTFCVLPDVFVLVLMQFLIGLGHTRTSMVFALLCVPLNIFSTYAFLFGKFGFPLLGIAGMGWGPALSYWVLSISLLTYLLVCKKYNPYFSNMLRIGLPSFLKELWQIGIPIGSMYFVELAFFLTLTLLMGHFGPSQLAANQIALQYLMLMTMVTFAVAQAVTVRMGHTLATKEIHLAKRACTIGVIIAVSFMFLIALCYWFMPDKLIALDLNIHTLKNSEVISYAKYFLAIAGLFQLLEAVRFVMFGALRSLKDTHFSLLTSILSFWVIALPLGYVLAVPFHLQGIGLWVGMVFGAACSSVLLSLRVSYTWGQI